MLGKAGQLADVILNCNVKAYSERDEIPCLGQTCRVGFLGL